MEEFRNVVCAGCGKMLQMPMPWGTSPLEDETFILCECGVETKIDTLDLGAPPKKEAGSGNPLGILNEILQKAVPVIQEIRKAKLPGIDTGIGEGLAKAAHQAVFSVLREDEGLRNALKAIVQERIQSVLRKPKKESEPEVESKNSPEEPF